VSNVPCNWCRGTSETIDSLEYENEQLRASLSAAVETSELILMPKSLTAENGAKGLLIGEFSETVIMQCEMCDGEGVEAEGGNVDDLVCEGCGGSGDYALKVTVSWDTIKEIYAKCVDNLKGGQK